MTPITLTIDRVFRGVGRINQRSGTTNPAVHANIGRMLTALHEEGRLDLLKAIRDHDLSMLEVYAAYRQRSLDKIAVGVAAKPLSIAMKTWIDKLDAGDHADADCSLKHKQSHQTSLRIFESHDADATVADLPQLLEELRDTSWAKRHPRSFNMARSSAQSFTRSTLKRSHSIYLSVAAVEPRRVKKGTKRTPLTPEQMRGFFPHPETDWLDAVAWGMATTGMGAKEYWGDWSVLADRIHIAGTKTRHRRSGDTAGRVRDVPLVMVPATPRYNRRKFEDDLRERTRSITVRDLRRTFANWLEAATVPRTRRRIYMGHEQRDTTDLYEHHEVAKYLAEDALKLTTYIGMKPKKRMGLVRNLG